MRSRRPFAMIDRESSLPASERGPHRVRRLQGARSPAVALNSSGKSKPSKKAKVLRDSAPLNRSDIGVAEVSFRPSVPRLKMASTVARSE